MHRRDVLLQLSASGLLIALPLGLRNLREDRADRLPNRAALDTGSEAFVFLTDQPGLQPDSPTVPASIVRLPANSFLMPSWNADLRVRSLRAALGAANALLLMGSLRDLRAQVHHVRRVGEIEWIAATLN